MDNVLGLLQPWFPSVAQLFGEHVRLNRSPPPPPGFSLHMTSSTFGTQSFTTASKVTTNLSASFLTLEIGKTVLQNYRGHSKGTSVLHVQEPNKTFTSGTP